MRRSSPHRFRIVFGFSEANRKSARELTVYCMTIWTSIIFVSPVRCWVWMGFGSRDCSKSNMSKPIPTLKMAAVF